MWRSIRGAAGRLPALALALAALGCARPLATLDGIDLGPRPVALKPSDTEPAPARSSLVVAIAKRHVGARYAWGGSGPAGFDCSGLVMYVYSHLGVALPHNAAKQYRYGTPVARERLEPGDVVFFDGLRHNGIYIGDGRFIHARRRGRGVIVSGLDESWYRTRWVGGRRFEVR